MLESEASGEMKRATRSEGMSQNKLLVFKINLPMKK